MTISEQSVPCVSVVQVDGPLLAPVKQELRRRVETLLARGRRLILVDLANVTNLDAAGVGELVHVYTLAAAGRAELWTENAMGRVQMLLERAGLFEILSADSEVTYERCS